jgi:hypothetical protein
MEDDPLWGWMFAMIATNGLTTMGRRPAAAR